MACTVTVNLTSVQHTLPTSFWGGATVGWDKNDCDNPNYLNIVKECGYEIMRDSMWIHDPGIASPFSEPPVRAEARRLVRNLRQAGETTKLWWCGGAAPNATMSAVTGTSSPYSTANIASDRYGPANHAAMIQHYLDDPDFGSAGLFAYGAYNEPATASGTTAGDPWRAWYTSAADAGGANSRDWSTAKTKPYSDAVRGVAPTLPIVAWEFASLPAYYAFSTNEFPSFLAPNATRPTAGGVNFPYTDVQHQASFDVVNFHLYGGQFPDDQSTMNAMYFPTWDGVTTQGVNNKSRLKGNMQHLRDLLDAAGLPTKQMAMSEYETPASTSSGLAYYTAAIDAAVGIVSCTMQSAFKIHQFQQFAVTATRTSPIPRNDWVIYWDGVDNFPYNGTTHIPNFNRGVRQYMARRVLSRYVRNYKRQLIGAANMPTAVVNGANTPGGASANPVGRVQAMAGLPNAANNEVAFVFQNADLTTPETVNIVLQSGSFTSHLTGHRMLKTVAYQNEDFAAVDITPSGSSTATLSLGPGEVVIVVAGISVSGGGGGSFPTTGTLDSFNRANENPLANGNWSSPVEAGHAALKIVSNQGAAAAALADSYWSATTFAADQEAYCDIPVLTAVGGGGVGGNTAGFEQGSNGATIAAADPGDATAWTAVESAGTGGSVTYDTTHFYGALAAKFVRPTTGSKGLRWDFTNNTDWFGRLYLWVNGNPSAKDYFIEIRGDGPTALCTRFAIKTDGKIAIDNQNGTEINVSANSIPLGQWIRLEWHVIHSTTAGQVIMRVYHNADSGTITETITTASNLNTRINGNRIRFGTVLTGQDGYTSWMDNLVAVATDWPGLAGGTSGGISVICRAQNPNNGTTAKAYRLYALPNSNLLRLQKLTAGHTETTIGDTAQTIAANDGLGLQVIGTTLNVWYRVGAGGTWTQKATYTDSTITGSGNIGAGIDDTTGRIDTFGGGAEGSPPVFNDSASGTISLQTSRTESASFTNTRSGTIGVSGSFVGPNSDAASGTLNLSGFGVDAFTPGIPVIPSSPSRDEDWGGDAGGATSTELTKGESRPSRDPAWGGGG